METLLLIKCFIGGLLGILFHVFVIKYPALKKRAAAVKVELSLSTYLKQDLVSIIGSVITVLIVIFIIDEIAHFRPEIMEVLKFFFIFVGHTGSSILQYIFGVADKKLRNIVDLKTGATETNPDE